MGQIGAANGQASFNVFQLVQIGTRRLAGDFNVTVGLNTALG